MREIKFRGKIKEKGMSESWLEGSLVHITKTYKGEEDEQECDIYQIINEDGVGFFIDKDTIGQYTGLKDKNGKEIYEGDIVKVENIDLAQIIYDEDRMAWGIEPINEFYFDSPLLADNVSLELQIIGNIYENPDLLEDKE